MTYELDPRYMSVESLAQRCAQETKLYFKKLAHDTKYCFELFRRAISERDNTAWNVIIIQYKPSVAKWVNLWADQHPDFPLARDDEEDFIEEAFLRFLKHFTPAKFGNAQDLDDVLQYLKTCVNSAILDIWRKMRRRQFDQQLEKNDDGEESVVPAESGPGLEQNVQNDELWQLVQSRLKDQKESMVVYATFHLGLSPRAIIAEYPKVFRDINEVYQCKANVSARLARDSDLRKLLNLDD